MSLVVRLRCVGIAIVVAIAGGCVEPPATHIARDTASRSVGKDDRELERRPFSDEEKAQSRGKLGGPWVQCYRSFEPAGDPAADLQRLTARCGRVTGLTPVTPVHVGAAQATEDAVERFVFRARGGHCYRVFAVGEADVIDLDIAVRDANGRIVAADLSHDRWPVVPPRGPLCLDKEDVVVTIEVAVVLGHGAYVLQVLRD